MRIFYGQIFASKKLDQDIYAYFIFILDIVLSIFEKYEIIYTKLISIISILGFSIYEIFHWIRRFSIFKR